MTNAIDNINDYFKLPIYYNEKKQLIKKNIIDDLELINTVDPSANNIYHYYFNTDNPLSQELVKQVSSYYTTDVNYLKDNQQLLKEYGKLNKKYTDYSDKYKNILDIWNEIQYETGFKEKYYYIDWPALEFLNKSEHFLQVMSVYNMASPIISLLVPIIILIIPFIIIKMKGLNLNINEYVQILKIIASQHAIGKLFTEYSSVTSQEKVYLLFSAMFYVFNIYQNILVCIRFNNNMRKIHNDLKEIRVYLSSTIENMNNFLKYSKHLSSFREFNENLETKKDILIHLKNKLESISEYGLSIRKIGEIGSVLKYFYELYEDKVYKDSLMYSLGFNGYIDCIEGLHLNIEERKISFAQFTSKKNKNVFHKGYYAVLKNTEHIKNTVKLNKNMIVTGPNASGKTTILKSTLINVIFSQQFGCGFYNSAKLCPYDYIHCYLNIPDTSGRDSLFQAEARRCKEIIDIIDFNKNQNHFCVFDELYSGTNPDEAITSATAFMEYITKNKNVNCLLTTHFIRVCKKLDKYKNIKNYHMVTSKKENKIVYHYILKEGISDVKGGINVLCDMNYPKEIIEKTIKDI